MASNLSMVWGNSVRKKKSSYLLTVRMFWKHWICQYHSLVAGILFSSLDLGGEYDSYDLIFVFTKLGQPLHTYFAYRLMYLIDLNNSFYVFEISCVFKLCK